MYDSSANFAGSGRQDRAKIKLERGLGDYFFSQICRS